MGSAKTMTDVTGRRGEKILELCLLEYEYFNRPLFNPGFLGDKWPAIDFYVELEDVVDSKPYFFGQAKSTRRALHNYVRISSHKEDIERLLRIPGPTYIFGIHEPSRRVFVKSVHSGTNVKAITRIPTTNELTAQRLRVLYDEVQGFWRSSQRKPTSSSFA